MSTETKSEMISRLTLMVEDGGDWDLSDNDKAAIRFALEAAVKAQAPTPSLQGGDTREKLAMILAKMNLPRAPLTLTDVLDYYRGEADKILSLIHPLPVREEEK